MTFTSRDPVYLFIYAPTSFGWREVLLKERDVLEEELLLEVLGPGGNDDALAREDGRHEIGQRLPGAGSGFDNQVLAIGQRGFDRFSHLELAGPVLVIRVPLGKRAIAGEELPRGGRFGGSGHWGLVRL